MIVIELYNLKCTEFCTCCQFCVTVLYQIGFVVQRFHNYMILEVLIIFWSKIKFI